MKFLDKKWSRKATTTNCISDMSDICDSRICCRDICQIDCRSSWRCSYAHRFDVIWCFISRTENFRYERNWFSHSTKITFFTLTHFNIEVSRQIQPIIECSYSKGTNAATKSFTFGYVRAEVIGALMSIVILWLWFQIDSEINRSQRVFHSNSMIGNHL